MTIEIWDMFCVLRSSQFEGMLRARIPIFLFGSNEFMRIGR